jgi:hypothetical protein
LMRRRTTFHLHAATYGLVPLASALVAPRRNNQQAAATSKADQSDDH